jgi:hypothetical protein
MHNLKVLKTVAGLALVCLGLTTSKALAELAPIDGAWKYTAVHCTSGAAPKDPNYSAAEMIISETDMVFNFAAGGCTGKVGPLKVKFVGNTIVPVTATQPVTVTCAGNTTAQESPTSQNTFAINGNQLTFVGSPLAADGICAKGDSIAYTFTK